MLILKLFYLGQDGNEETGKLAISFGVIERQGPPSVPAATGSTDTVDILVNVVREVKVDHMLHIWNIQTPGSYRGGHQDCPSAGAKVCQSLLSLPLLTVTEGKQIQSYPHSNQVWIQTPVTITYP